MRESVERRRGEGKRRADRFTARSFLAEAIIWFHRQPPPFRRRVTDKVTTASCCNGLQRDAKFSMRQFDYLGRVFKPVAALE